MKQREREGEAEEGIDIRVWYALEGIAMRREMRGGDDGGTRA